MRFIQMAFSVCFITLIVSGCQLTKNQHKLEKLDKRKLKNAIAIIDNEKIEAVAASKKELEEIKSSKKKSKNGTVTKEEFDQAESVVKDMLSGSGMETDSSTMASEPNEVKLNMDSLTMTDLLAVLDTLTGAATPDKFSLDPDTTFYGFSTGATFEFVDGIDDASLFLDINANVGQIFHESLTAEFGVLSGRFSPNFTNISGDFALGGVEILSDTTFRRTSFLGDLRQSIRSERKFTRAFARFNWKLIDQARSNSKLFLTVELSYNRSEFNTSLTQDTLNVQTRVMEVEIGNRTAVEPSFPSDSLYGNLIQDRNTNMIGLKLFKGGDNFQFTVTGLAGLTLINNVSVETNDDSRNPLESPLFA